MGDVWCELTQVRAVEHLRNTVRHAGRPLDARRRRGDRGLLSGRRGKASNNRRPAPEIERIETPDDWTPRAEYGNFQDEISVPPRIRRFLKTSCRKANVHTSDQHMTYNDIYSNRALKIFISYSRRDVAFADKLATALKARGMNVMIDHQDLPKLEDWERELARFIREADTVIFIVSNQSLASKVCAWEIQQVVALSKRLAPVLLEYVDHERLPASIARINYINFTDSAAFEERADELKRALNTDNAWVKEHTRLAELAQRWTEHGHPEWQLLRGKDFQDAEVWRTGKPSDEAGITSLQHSFLNASWVLERDAREVLRVRQRNIDFFGFCLMLPALSITGQFISKDAYEMFRSLFNIPVSSSYGLFLAPAFVYNAVLVFGSIGYVVLSSASQRSNPRVVGLALVTAEGLLISALLLFSFLTHA